jgi:hypothetical protein
VMVCVAVTTSWTLVLLSGAMFGDNKRPGGFLKPIRPSLT